MFNSTDSLSASAPAIRFYHGWFDTVSLKEVGTSDLYLLDTDLFTISSFRFIAYSPDLLAITGSRPSKGINRLHL